ncbi:siphovirus ReqiPepy6 Gp37-like family protein [Kibdelosporangium phytohabitans]|uniref:Gp28/Gp37-like domain-containing protein n=1 Tax=Kibdelosporangium phytohabitans TaxID=860235 RepID=A0A0N9HM82_9PSEU|nr:hypothetical protein AOZ06_12835 [Kibdelosporangium phytohabitans]ALG07731.1 hypothetical protein AOZ06_13155 [Kibdelosporangium phytohabitans]MBE1471364.1 hypothetical protein [Kibdelosporangium phytohabitans]
MWLIRPNGTIAGTLPYTRLSAVERYVDVGTWLVDCPLTTRTAAAATSVGGWRVAIMDGTRTLMAGPVEHAEIELGRDETSGRKVAKLRYSGVDDMVWLAARQAWPVPANAVTAQTVGYDVRTGVASTVIGDYVIANAGVSAQVERRVPGLILDPLAVPVGEDVYGRARFQPLLELVQDISVAGGVGVRVLSGMGAEKRLQVYTPRDLRGPARFGLMLRNLRRVRWSTTAPQATTIIGGGRGEEEARDFIAVTNAGEETAWGRREGFYDYRSASDADGNAELTSGASKRLAETGATRQVELAPVDSSRMQYGRDYGLGDRVTVDVYAGVTLDSIIREVETTVERADSKPTRTVVTRVGDIGTGRDKSSAGRVIKNATLRMSNLERR